jgi:hypothetical protein
MGKEYHHLVLGPLFRTRNNGLVVNALPIPGLPWIYSTIALPKTHGFKNTTCSAAFLTEDFRHVHSHLSPNTQHPTIPLNVCAPTGSAPTF